MNFFEKLNLGIRDGEASVVNLLSAIAPWAAPLAPAYMSFSNMQTYLDFPWWVAGAVAAVVEILGLSTISTSMEFWRWNRSAAKYAKAPLWLAILAFIFYLLVVMLMNVALEASGTNPNVVVVARAMLTLLSVPAALVLAMRTQHTYLLHSIENARNERRAQNVNQATSERTANEQRTAVRTNGHSKERTDTRDKIMAYLNAQRAQGNAPGPTQISQVLGVSKSYASTVLKEADNGKPV